MKKVIAVLLAVLFAGCAPLPAAGSSKSSDDDLLAALLADEPKKPINVTTDVLLEDEVTPDLADAIEAQLKVTDGKDVIVHINSPGGSVSAGLRIIKAIEGHKGNVTCRVDFFAASMAFTILQSCPVREMTDRSILMTHEGSGGARGKMRDLKNELAKQMAIEHAMENIECKKLKVSCDDYRKMVANDAEVWLSDVDALKLGAVDKVIK